MIEEALTSQSITCDHLTKVYDRKRKTKALYSVCFSVPSKGIFVLIGRNGSGKTTLVRILSTELEPTSGSATINGINVVKAAKILREKIAIVPQEARPITWMTPIQAVSSYLMWRGFEYGEARERAAETLDRLGLSKVSTTLNSRLSGGMRRKVLVASVLASEAEIIFLDEPTTGLDPISRREFWSLLKEIGKERFAFLTTHYLEEAEELGDKIGILGQGKMIGLGTLSELRSKMNYSYSMRIPHSSNSPIPVPHVSRGEVIAGKDGYRILTVEDEAFKISADLARSGLKFTINPITLDDIFFYLVSREGEIPVAVQRETNEEE